LIIQPDIQQAEYHSAAQIPLTDFQQILHSLLCLRPHPTCKCWGQSVQRGRVCACVKISPSGVFFLSFFRSHAPRYRSEVGPLDRSTPLQAQTTRPVGILIPYMVWMIKINIFPIFTTKCEKLHYSLWQLRTAITPAPLKIHARCLHQTGGFGGRAIEWCPLNLPLIVPCCHGKQPPLFEHKIGNKSACMGDTTPIPGASRELSGSANLTVLVKFVPDQPLLPWQRKFENFNTKLAITRLVWEIRPPFLHLLGVIGVGEFNCASEICAKPNHVAMATKI